MAAAKQTTEDWATRAKALELAERAAETSDLPPLALAAAAAIQLAAGFEDPRDYYIRRGAEALLAELAARESAAPAPAFSEEQATAGEQLWELARPRAGEALPSSTLALWVDPLRAAGATETELWLTAPPPVRAWLERRYLPRLQAAVDATCDEHERPHRTVRIAER